MSRRSARLGVASGLVLLCATSVLACPRPVESIPQQRPPGSTNLDASMTLEDGGLSSPSLRRDGAWSFDNGASAIDPAVEAALLENKLPGCVVVVGTRDRILFRKAYGLRSVDPAREVMQVDTVFDLASLTKPLATASSLFVLEERGLISLDDPVSKHMPVFSGRGKEAITIRQLLLHTSGLPAITARSDYARGIGDALAKLSALAPGAPPGARFRYSDVGFIVLGEVVARVANKSLDVFAREVLYEPLGMRDTGFLPPATLRPRIAPTERRDGVMLRGEVHDPIAAALGGVAGNAGLFGTADDVARFAQAVLGKGALRGKRVLAEPTLRRMLAVHDVPTGLRALGWDVRSSLSLNRAERMSRRAVGHGGYTGTGLWIDPARDLFVVFLSNRVHPDGKGAVGPLIARISGLALDARDAAQPERKPFTWEACDRSARTSGGPPAAVMVGVDVLAGEGFRRLAGKRVALLSNSGARAASGRTTFHVLKEAIGDRLTLLYVPEHGFGADAEGKIEDGALEGVPVKSLYGARLSADDATLATFDVLVVDLPDVGARYFTYGATLHRMLKAAGAKEKPVIVLDRPNPYGGVQVDGPTEIAPGSFVQHHPLSLLHGMTTGELAYLLDADGHFACELDVVPVQGWRRGTMFDETGLDWTPPSPNLKTFAAALAYAATALVEGTNVSVGRGTLEPFEVVGAPWLKPDSMVSALGAMGLLGVSFEASTVTPTVGPHAGKTVPAVRLKIVDRAAYRPVRVGLGIAVALQQRHAGAGEWDSKRLDEMIGARLAHGVREGLTVALLEGRYRSELLSFASKRQKHLLYGICAPTLDDAGVPLGVPTL